MTTANDTLDFYDIEQLLPESDRQVLSQLRTFLRENVEPIINEHWIKGTFPHEIIAGFADLDTIGTPYRGYGLRGSSYLLDGLIAMELATADPSISTFCGVHSGLAMGSIFICGSDEQKDRWLPAMSRMEQIGAFALTEPDVGSGIAGGMETTAKRDGDGWVLNGQKKWIGNATFADLLIVWARDVADDNVKGFVVPRETAGVQTELIEDKISLRAVQNATITLTDVRVAEDDRLQNANSFEDTAEVLRVTRAGVAWQAVGCARGAYRYAREYALEREQFGRPIASFQLVQEHLVTILTNTTASVTMCARLSQLQDEGRATDAQSAMAKVFATMRMRESVGHARELMGGNGILLEHNVGRFVADAEAIYSYEGTREINTLIVGREITGHSAFV